MRVGAWAGVLRHFLRTLSLLLFCCGGGVVFVDVFVLLLLLLLLKFFHVPELAPIRTTPPDCLHLTAGSWRQREAVVANPAHHHASRTWSHTGAPADSRNVPHDHIRCGRCARSIRGDSDSN